MQGIKKSLLIGAGVVTLGVGGLGITSIASADTTSSTTGESSLVDKIANKFNLDKTKVQAVFDEDRSSHRAEMKANRTAALKQAVTDGKLTQSQADYIATAWEEIDKLHDGAGSPQTMTDAQRTEIKTKMDALRTWEKDQNLDLRSILGIHGGSRGMHNSNHTSTNTQTN